MSHDLKTPRGMFAAISSDDAQEHRRGEEGLSRLMYRHANSMSMDHLLKYAASRLARDLLELPRDELKNLLHNKLHVLFGEAELDDL